MKIDDKIFLDTLPPALEKALFAHLDVTVIPAEASLVVTTQPVEALAQAHPARPILCLDVVSRTYRLGSLLRQIRQMALAPSLYLENVALGPHQLMPQDRQLVCRDGTEIPLTDKETDILCYLARQHPTIARRNHMLYHVWRFQEGIDTHTLETHIYRLRQKLEKTDAAQLLVTAEKGYSLSF